MKELLILSGKGGTGKTTIATAFIKLSKTKVYADCDVDAPNLHLLMTKSEASKKRDYIGLPKAVIDQEKCTSCGLCKTHCRFDAIKESQGRYEIDYYACEGCGVCEAVCESDAVKMLDDVAGELMLYNESDYFSTAKLKMGSGTSGKLVSEVKKQLKENDLDMEFSVVDGSPGIGCPVVASLSGADVVLIVTEPTLSGISDMDRIIKTANNFRMKVAVCVNRFDTNQENTLKIQSYCKQEKIPFVGKIPNDKRVSELLNQGKSIIDEESPLKEAVIEVYKQTVSILLD
jgi:MinD superfamily P-loop ATPase